MQLHGRSFEGIREKGNVTGRLPAKWESWPFELLKKKMSGSG